MHSAKTLLLLIFFLGNLLITTAQNTKSTEHVNQVWAGYSNQTRFSNKWGIWGETQLRTKENFTHDLSTGILRLGLTYYLNDNAKLTAGYAFVNAFPGDNHANISQPEHRPWQQLQWHTKYQKLRLMQWIRLEERFRHKIADNDNLAAGYNYNWRIRYNILAMFPLSKNAFAPKTFSLVLNDEVHVNLGKQIVYNYFDQNRFFAGFAYHTNAADNLQFGYMNLFQQLATGNRYKNLHVIRIFYFHNLDLRKK